MTGAVVKTGRTQSDKSGLVRSVQPDAPPQSLLNIIAAAAQNPDVDVNKLTALLDLQERVLAREAEAEFNAALARLSADLPRVKKNGTVELGAGKGSYAFARWEDMDTILRPRMAAEGFTLSFDTHARDGGGGVVTGTLLHRYGHKRSSAISLPLDAGPGRNNLQAMGSTLSYGKRYTAEMLLNIVREGQDTDGVPPPAQITEAQAMEIEALLLKTKSDRAAFMAHFKLSNLLEMNEDDRVQAVNMLGAKLKKLTGMQVGT